jgi:hypothetical protein
MARSREARTIGLGYAVALALGRVRKPVPKESTLFRSLAHRKNVAALPCMACQRSGCQAAHANYGKGGALKVCDSLTFPLCPDCHREHDQGGIPKQVRRRREVAYVYRTRDALIARGLWSPAVEEAFQRAYEPMKRAIAA